MVTVKFITQNSYIGRNMQAFLIYDHIYLHILQQHGTLQTSLVEEFGKLVVFLKLSLFLNLDKFYERSSSHIFSIID